MYCQCRILLNLPGTVGFHAIYSILNSTKETSPKVWALTQRLSDSTAMKVGPENERQET